MKYRLYVLCILLLVSLSNISCTHDKSTNNIIPIQQANGSNLSKILENLPNDNQISNIELINIENKNLGDANTQNSIGNILLYADENKKINLSINSDITEIGDNAFLGCMNLETIDLSKCKQLKTIGVGAFSECTSLKSIKIGKDNPYFRTEKGVLFNNEKTKLICFPAGKTTDKYSIPKSVTIIDKFAFNYSKLKNINFKNCKDLREIDENAFDNSNNLESLNLSPCLNLHTIHKYAFSYCTDLKTIDLEKCNNLIAIGEFAFANNTYATATLPSNSKITTIAQDAFGRHGGNIIKKIIIPHNQNTNDETSLKTLLTKSGFDVNKITTK